MNRTDRLTGILLALQGGQQTAAQLAARFEVSRRTILRDVDALCQIGVPVVALPGAGGGLSLAEGYWLPPLHLSHAEGTLLLLAVQALGDADVSPFGEARRTAEEKLRAVFRPDVLKEAERELGTLAIARARHIPEPEQFRTLRSAIKGGQWLQVRYQSLRRVAVHLLFPLKLYADGGYWYCSAVSLDAQEERLYRLDRIQDAAPVQAPPGANEARRAAAQPQRAYADPAHPEVIVRLTYRGLRKAEDIVRRDDVFHQLNGGTWELRFRCPPGELDYYAHEIHAMGPEAEALSPPELRARVRALASTTAKIYAVE